MHYPIVIFIIMSVIYHRHHLHSGYQQQYLLAPLTIKIFFLLNIRRYVCCTRLIQCCVGVIVRARVHYMNVRLC